MKIKIEKKIKVPKRHRNGKWKSLAKEMGLTDSVLLNRRIDYIGLRTAIARIGFRVVSRTEANGKIRLWKMEK